MLTSDFRRRARRALWLLLLICALSGTQARAQEYRLGPRDVLSVIVLRHPELSAPKIEIDPGGRIRLPFVGSVVAAGKTTSDLTAQIRSGLKRQLNDPTVTVTLLQTRPQQVSVSGAVKTPGLLEIGPNWRISEAIAAAGGLTTSSETATATFSRAGGSAVGVNLSEILRNGGSPENRRLRAGDALRISENTLPIRIAGEVKTPGPLDVPRGSLVTEAIALAGGFAPGAAQRGVTVTDKSGATITLNLGPGTNNGRRVQPGDLIVVPASTDRISVLGAVAKAGTFALEAGQPLFVSQALAQAGGLNANAALTRASLARANGSTVPLDLYALTVLGDKSRNLALQPGDIITVPEARGITVFGAVLKPGTYPLEAARAPRVLDAITAAGGLVPPPSDVKIRVQRASGGALSIVDAPAPKRTIGELLALNAAKTGAANATNATNGLDAAVLNARVYDGDLITVEAVRPLSVTVRGEVTTEGRIEAREGTTLTEVLTRAGGPNGRADLRRVTVKHADGSNDVFDVYDAFVKGAATPPIVLREGDDVVVPRSERLIYVVGAVKNSEYYAVPERGILTVGESLSLAGGTLPGAKLNQIVIIRSTPQGVKRTQINLNQKSGKSLDINAQVRAGDVVYVPEANNSPSIWTRITAALGVLSLFR